MDTEETVYLNDAEYNSGDELMGQNENDQVEVDSQVSTTASKPRRKYSRCWKSFVVVEPKLPDGRSNIRCIYCHYNYCYNVRKSGTTMLLRHMDSCEKIPGSTPGCNKKLDMLVFREMIAVAIIEHDLPYSFVKASESREKAFQNCVETVGIETKASLVLDVKTRWNSTNLMLSRAIMLKDALRNLAEVEPNYKSCPSDLEWYRGELICELLTSFAEMTNLVSGFSYPTANLYFMQVWTIERWLRLHAESPDEIICIMVESMQLKFDKYWEEYNDVLAMAVVLDPRLKLTFLEYCFSTLDASTFDSKVEHVREKMKKFFKVYKKNPSKTSAET